MKLPTFQEPPIDEVVCGVVFTSERALQTIDIGRYWSSVSADFPVTEDRAPIIQIPSNATFDLAGLPPIRRAWLHSSDGTRLIQLQENQFFYNWRKRSEEQKYPRYEVVIQEFLTRWAGFTEWAKIAGLGAVRAKQFQLSYVNHITSANGWDGPSSSHKILSYISKLNGQVFQNLETLTTEMRTALPSHQGTLAVSVNHGMKVVTQSADPVPVLVVNLVATSMSMDVNSPKEWFDIARDSIVNGFIDITTPNAHRIWGLES